MNFIPFESDIWVSVDSMLIGVACGFMLLYCVLRGNAEMLGVINHFRVLSHCCSQSLSNYFGNVVQKQQAHIAKILGVTGYFGWSAFIQTLYQCWDNLNRLNSQSSSTYFGNVVPQGSEIAEILRVINHFHLNIKIEEEAPKVPQNIFRQYCSHKKKSYLKKITLKKMREQTFEN